jgi:hypothetical protein
MSMTGENENPNRASTCRNSVGFRGHVVRPVCDE